MDRAQNPPERDQAESVRQPTDAAPGAIISQDTQRRQRISPGQSRARKWLAPDASRPPRIDLSQWKLRVSGMVDHPFDVTGEEFNLLRRVRVFFDFHFVTRWSRLGHVPLADLLPPDSVIATHHYGVPIAREHGAVSGSGPGRVPGGERIPHAGRPVAGREA